MENLSGQHIKGYELQERIGAGGFGAVYKAHQSTVGREVAIKIILPHYANHPDFIRRFETEAQLVARLEHLHIVPLYDYWRDPDGAYLVMRYMRGGTLHAALQAGPFESQAAALLLDQIAAALATAHRANVVHRDIKPGNILLDDDGNAFLADFGIAKDVAAGGSVTEADAIVGSPDYLAPEQARAEAVTPATDIYSLGVVLYELMAGEHPFPNVNAIERLFKHLNEPLPYIEKLPEEQRDGINEVIRKATAKDPALRFQDVLEMAAAFRQVTKTNLNLVETLTQREHEVLRMIIDGRSNKEIAQVLFLSVATVKWHITQIYNKLGVRNRVQAIVRARELDLIARPNAVITPSQPVSTEDFHPENPYKGLRAFQSADYQDFYGREKLVEKLLKRLQLAPTRQGEDNGLGGRFLAVVGPSGSGKSSLVKAGLIPALWRGDIPGSEAWFVVEMLPGSHPLDELEVALTRVAANQAGNLREQLSRDARGLLRTAQLILPDDGSELVIVIDQFEEVFTLVEDETRRVQFLDLIYTAVTELRSRVRVVVTLRADFYDRPLYYPQFGDLLRSRMETVLPLSADGLERAITRPAERVGVSFEAGLVSSIIGEINYQAGALPLLQYALTELFEQRQGRLLTYEAYHTIGKTTGALARRADGLYNELNSEGKEAARQMFLRLVTLGEGTEDTRRRTSRAELLAIGDADLMEEVIDTFGQYRLLSFDNDPATREPTVEVAHEAILREWERLREWLNASREEIRIQRQLAHAAADWIAAKRETSFLLHGTRLETFEKWATATSIAITPDERAYLNASIATHEHKQAEETERQARETRLENRSRTVLRALVAVFAVAALLSAGLSIFAFGERGRAEANAAQAEQNANEFRSIALISGAEQALDNKQPDAALALAREAVNMENPPVQAERAFFQIAHSSWIKQRFTGHTKRVFDALYFPDGKRIITSSHDGRVIIWDAATGEIIQSLEHAGRHNFMALHPDGKRVAIGSDNATAFIWNLETDQVQTFVSTGTWQQATTFNPDGSLLLNANDDGTINVWDIATGQLTRTIQAHDGSIFAIHFSPDESLLVTASQDGSVKVWDFASGELIQTFEGREGDWAWEALFLADGEHILLGGDNLPPTLWAWRSDEVIWSGQNPSIGVQDIAFSPDERLFATGSNGDTSDVYLWDTQTGQLLRTYQGHSLRVQHVDFSPDGQWIVSASEDHTAIVWPVRWEGTQSDHIIPNMGNISVLHPTERWAAVSELNNNPEAAQGIVRLIDIDTGEVIRTFSGHQENAVAGSFSPDGRLLVTSEVAPSLAMNEMKIYLWEVETGVLLHTLNTQKGWVVDTEFSPYGSIIAFSEMQGTPVILWDTQTGELIRKLEGDTPRARSVFSPDGQTLYSAGADGGLDVWNVASGEKLDEWAGHPLEIVRIDLSTDGTLLATASTDGTAALWDTTNGERLMTLVGHSGDLSSVNFSLDSRYLVTGSRDSTLILWEVATGKALRRYVGHNIHTTGNFVNGEFLPDGKSIVSFGENRLMLWDAAPLPEDLTNWVSKNRYIPELTCEQRALYHVEPLCEAN